MASLTYTIADPSNQVGSNIQTSAGSFQVTAKFNPTTDFVRAYIYDNNGRFVNQASVNPGISIPGQTSPDEVPGTANITYDYLHLDPLQQGNPLILNALDQSNIDGSTAIYRFTRNRGSYRIKEISFDRTEVKISPVGNIFPRAQIANLTNIVLKSVYYGKVGIALDQGAYAPIINISDDGKEFIYLKLSTALSDELDVEANITLQQEIADPVTVSFTYVPDEVPETPSPTLRGPNFSIDLDDRSTVTTEYLDYNDLYNLPVTNSYNRIFSELEGSGVNLSVDYTDYSNFIHFSSAKERLANFKYKLNLLHQYERERADVQALSAAANVITSSNLYYDNLIKGILTKFDGYERYLYYESSSKSWPKSNSTQPYLNLTSSAAASVAWYEVEYASASLYDELNESNLEYTIPEFIRQDSNNAPYSLFLNMIGQHFDELWLYADGITQKYDADNRLDYGISRDLVEKTLQGLGTKLYSSNFSANNLANLFLGEWFDTGSEQINTFVTASNEPTPDKYVLSETYKRIYHNLPYLIKTKGTERGLRALINCFGIPSSSLSIEVFGGTVRQEDSYFGYEYGSGPKVRLDNTGSIVEGNTLSQYASIVTPADIYTNDLHVVEVGFSPTKWLDEYIKDILPGNYLDPPDYFSPYQPMPATYVYSGEFNLDNYIGDPRYIGFGSYNVAPGYSLREFALSALSNSGSYDVKDFLRLTKFFDNQLFKMVKDFTPARDVVSAGIIIKPNILDRSKVPSPTPVLSQHEYSGSIDTAFITGSASGILNNLSTTYTASVLTPSGSIIKYYDDQAARFNGELGGTIMKLYTGSLNEANNLKKPSTLLPRYVASGSTTDSSPAQGVLNWQAGLEPNQVDPDYQIKYLYINEVDANGENIENALGNLKPGDKITFTVKYQDIIP